MGPGEPPKKTSFTCQWRIQGGRIGRGPPFFRPCFFFCFHPRGRSGRRTVYPPPHNVNAATTQNQGGCVGVPPPLSDFFRHRSIWIPGPPFSQILDPSLHAMSTFDRSANSRGHGRRENNTELIISSLSCHT